MKELLDDYLDTLTTEPLSESEERKLFNLYKNGDESAKYKLFEANRRLAFSIAKRYFSTGIDKMDIVQEANQTLLIAIDKFDINTYNRFSTYAVPAIQNRLYRFTKRNKYMELIPYKTLCEIYNYKKGKRELEMSLGRYPTRKELSSYLNIPIDKMDFLEVNTTASLNSLIKDTEDELIDFIKDDSVEEFFIALDYSLLKDKMNNFIDNSILTDKEKRLIKLSFGINSKEFSNKDLASLFNISPQDVKSTIITGINKLRCDPKVYEFLDYLDYPNKGREYVNKFKTLFSTTNSKGDLKVSKTATVKDWESKLETLETFNLYKELVSSGYSIQEIEKAIEFVNSKLLISLYNRSNNNLYNDIKNSNINEIRECTKLLKTVKSIINFAREHNDVYAPIKVIETDNRLKLAYISAYKMLNEVNLPTSDIETIVSLLMTGEVDGIEYPSEYITKMFGTKDERVTSTIEKLYTLEKHL